MDLKIAGEGLPATDLESFLPALGINLPDKSRLSAGTMNTNLHVSGPTDKLVTDGNIGLFNGKLAGFDLGQKLSGIGALAGIKSGGDLIIEKFTTDLHMATTGLRADNLDAVVPALGSMVGNGTVDAKNNLDFKLIATVNNNVATAAAGSVAGGMVGGTVGKMLGGGAGAARTAESRCLCRFTAPPRARNLCRTSAAQRPACSSPNSPASAAAAGGHHQRGRGARWRQQRYRPRTPSTSSAASSAKRSRSPISRAVAHPFKNETSATFGLVSCYNSR